MFNTKRKFILILMISCLVFTVSCTVPDFSNSANDKEAKQVSIADEDVVSVEEQVLLDQNGVVISLKSIEYDGIYGPSLKVLIENNSDKAITVQTRNSSVNGVMVKTIFSSSIEPQKKVNDNIIFIQSDLDAAAISIVKDISFNFHISDNESWTESFDTDMIEIVTNEDSENVQDYDDSGLVVFDENDLKIVIKKANSEDSFWGADVYVYLENNSDKNISVQARDVSINGFMVDPIFSCDVATNKKAFETITFFESDLKDNGIEHIEEMELSFYVFNTDDWLDAYDTPKISVTFE